jgi:hypothetical protein
MPYMKVTENGKTKVFKKGPDGKPMGKMMGEHDSEAMANEQIASLNASEDEDKDATKEAGDHTKCGYYDDYIFVPWGVTSFADLEAARQMEEAGKEARKLTSAFSQIASNILGSMDISNKAQALTRLASEFTSKIGNTIRGKEVTPAPEQDTETLSTSLLSLSQPENEHPAATPAGEGVNLSAYKEAGVETSLLIWKEGGVYKWVAAYSNNFRDDDNPPEIISAQSHKEFDEALSAGQWPMPELWLWHLPYPVGQATTHAFDEETGFTLSAGEFYKEMAWAAEGVQEADWSEVSHGMPTAEIQRDEKDNTIITRHRTREISFLPKGKAANRLAFSIISKETDMAIPAHKRDEFVKAFGTDKVAEIEQALEGKAAQAKEAGIEQKEQAEAATPEAAPTPETQQPQPAITLEALAQAIAGAIKPVVEEVKALQAEVKELKRTDAEKIAEKTAATPAASLEAMIMEQVGGGLFGKATQVDGRTSLAQSKPKEAATKKGTGLFFDSWIGPAQQ